MTFQRKEGFGERIAAAWQALRGGRAVRSAQREHHRTLVELGEELVVSRQAPSCAALEGVIAAEERIRVLEAEITTTLAQDRRDYGAMPRLLKPAVVVRGIAARAVLRGHVRNARVELTDSHARVAAFTIGMPVRGRAAVLSEHVKTAEAKVREVCAARSRALVEAGLSPAPPLLARIGRESAHLGKAIAAETRSHVVPRIPGLVGLAAGWWLAHTYTDSQWSATVHAWGFGDGPRRALKPETYRMLAFWLPIAAGGIASYLGLRLGAFFRARYGAEPPQR